MRIEGACRYGLMWIARRLQDGIIEPAGCRASGTRSNHSLIVFDWHSGRSEGDHLNYCEEEGLLVARYLKVVLKSPR